MQTTPTDVKKGKIVSFLTPRQRTAWALTSKKQLQWMRPILDFTNLPMTNKIQYLKTTETIDVPDDVILQALEKQHDPNILISLLTELPARNKHLKKKIESLIEKRIRDRNYRKLIKKTLIRIYLQYLIQQGKSVSRFLDSINSKEVKSFAIAEYVLLKRNDFSPRTLRKWTEKISDPMTREKTSRTLHLV